MSRILTQSGLAFPLRAPFARDVRIEDIAHALSLTCRFGGHCREFYSVAQHSYFVSYLVEPEHALAGLLHDAAEAYVGDVVRPLKRKLARYATIEAEVWCAIAARYGIGIALPREVVEADERMLATEIRDLMPRCAHADELLADLPAPMPGLLEAVGPHESELLFLQRFDELTNHETKLRTDAGAGE